MTNPEAVTLGDRTYAKRRPKAPVLPAENVIEVQFAAGRPHSSHAAKLASEAA
jgi:hypothetical protein